MKKLSLAIACVAILGTTAFAGNGKKEKAAPLTSENGPIKKQKKHHECKSKHKMEKTVSNPHTETPAK
jgi:hypothetical protein